MKKLNTTNTQHTSPIRSIILDDDMAGVDAVGSVWYNSLGDDPVFSCLLESKSNVWTCLSMFDMLLSTCGRRDLRGDTIVDLEVVDGVTGLIVNKGVIIDGVIGSEDDRTGDSTVSVGGVRGRSRTARLSSFIPGRRGERYDMVKKKLLGLFVLELTTK